MATVLARQLTFGLPVAVLPFIILLNLICYICSKI